MKTINSWGKPFTILALGLSIVGYLNAPSTAVTNTTTANVAQKSELNSSGHQGNIQLAQSVVGQCRAANQRIFIYPERSTSSQSIRTLAPDEQVTLAESGTDGWVAISFPVAGYVRAIDLKACPGGTRPPDTQPPTSGGTQTGANICRNVIAPPEGLAVRGTPVSSAPRIAGVYVGNTVRLASPRETQKDTQGRTWVRITTPSTGWISSGYPDTNLSPEFSCP